MRDEGTPGELHHRDSVGTRHAREGVEKHIQRITRLEILDQRLHRDTCPRKDGGAAQPIGRGEMSGSGSTMA